jgi:hypothetical protein
MRNWPAVATVDIKNQVGERRESLPTSRLRTGSVPTRMTIGARTQPGIGLTARQGVSFHLRDGYVLFAKILHPTKQNTKHKMLTQRK